MDGERLIALVGGSPGAKVVAFDKLTGAEIWRALPSDSEPGYSQPTIIAAGGVRQLIIWHPEAVVALDPESGEVYWEQPVRAGAGMGVHLHGYQTNLRAGPRGRGHGRRHPRAQRTAPVRVLLL